MQERVLTHILYCSTALLQRILPVYLRPTKLQPDTRLQVVNTVTLYRRATCYAACVFVLESYFQSRFALQALVFGKLSSSHDALE